jgi:tetratricopeptide (TPR) repeat protein
MIRLIPLKAAAAVLLIGTAGLAPLAAAQERPTQPSAPIEPPTKLPRPAPGDRAKNLDFLFEALKAAPDEETAKHVEQRIWALWFFSGSDTADLLMGRVKSAFEAKDFDLALQLLDAVIAFKPDYAEAWNRRATIHFLQKNYGSALADLRQVLAREPRHFGALAGLGMILQEIGEEKRALEVFRRALAVHPRLERIPDIVRTLTDKVEGRDI